MHSLYMALAYYVQCLVPIVAGAPGTETFAVVQNRTGASKVAFQRAKHYRPPTQPYYSFICTITYYLVVRIRSPVTAYRDESIPLYKTCCDMLWRGECANCLGKARSNCLSATNRTVNACNGLRLSGRQTDYWVT